MRRACYINSLWMVWILTWVAMSGGVSAQQVIIDNVTPQTVGPGEFFILQGRFDTVEKATAFVANGQVSVPVEVIAITNDQILGRLGVAPWPMAGAVHLFSLTSTLERGGVTIDRGDYSVTLENATASIAGETALGGPLFTSGDPSSMSPTTFLTNGTLAWAEGITIGCEKTTGTTYFIEIEPSAPGSTPMNVCPATSLTFEFSSNADPTTGQGDYYLDLSEAFNQTYSQTGLKMQKESGGVSGDGFSISHTDCIIDSGSVGVYCTFPDVEEPEPSDV